MTTHVVASGMRGFTYYTSNFNVFQLVAKTVGVFFFFFLLSILFLASLKFCTGLKIKKRERKEGEQGG